MTWNEFDGCRKKWIGTEDQVVLVWFIWEQANDHPGVLS